MFDLRLALPSSARKLPGFYRSKANPVDLSKPLVVFNRELPANTAAFNSALMAIPEVLSERVKLRIGTELYVTYKGRKTYRRLNGLYLTVSAPNAAQAMLFVETLHRFAADLEGKWLAPLPEVGSHTAEPSDSTSDSTRDR